MTRVSGNLVSWGISAALHILLLVLVLPPGGLFNGRGIRHYEVGWVEMVEARGNQDALAVKTPSAGIVDQPRPLPDLRSESRSSQPPVTNKPPGTRNEIPEPPKHEPAAQNPGTQDTESARKGRGGGSLSMGSGEQFVIDRPVYYPKNAQNEGIGGRVRVVLLLSANGSIQASILESSGDDRLDRYSIRAVTEAWKYARPPSSVRIVVSLVFSGDRAEVVFEGSEVWDGEGM